MSMWPTGGSTDWSIVVLHKSEWIESFQPSSNPEFICSFTKLMWKCVWLFILLNIHSVSLSEPPGRGVCACFSKGQKGQEYLSKQLWKRLILAPFVCPSLLLYFFIHLHVHFPDSDQGTSSHQRRSTRKPLRSEKTLCSFLFFSLLKYYWHSCYEN